MRIFPQELVEGVIDELAIANLSSHPSHPIAPYLLVSRARVTCTWQHCYFNRIYFDGSDQPEKWYGKVAPDPTDVSQHARYLDSFNINTLAGIEEGMEIAECNFLLSPSVVECPAPMNPSLARLKIDESPTTSRITTSILTALPRQLKSFSASDSKYQTTHRRPASVMMGHFYLNLRVSCTSRHWRVEGKGIRITLCKVLFYIVRLNHHRRTLLDRGVRFRVRGDRLHVAEVEVDGPPGEAPEGKEFFKLINETFKEPEFAKLTSLWGPRIPASIYTYRGTGRLVFFGRFTLWGSGCVDRKPLKQCYPVAVKQTG